MNRWITSILITLMLVTQVQNAFGQPLSQEQRLLLSAIDLPLTPDLVERARLDQEQLLNVLKTPTEFLYLRGRALVALALLNPPDVLETLESVCVGPYPFVLKKQAVISLARYRTGKDVLRDRLLDLMSRTSGPLFDVVLSELAHLKDSWSH